MVFNYECGDCESTPCRCEMLDHEAFPHLFKAPKSAKCEAIQYSDQMVCKRCNQAWDVNDFDPPKCKKD